ncbi:little elongation complex subunit 2-like [Haliotis rufescens]|uniref:little elongation complex subunit 2-like n=1 Tax=Haliotis rufescens TaxID=6454 RepID=UPI00201EF7A7|nr:little elongation complex subunit 2-like [Haliotis rufescens]
MDRFWKEPINGTTVFFSEESFTRVLGTVSLQERLAIKFGEIRDDVQSTPVVSQYQAHASKITTAVPTQGPKRKDPGEAKKKQAPALKMDSPASSSAAVIQPGHTTQKPKGRKSSLTCKEQRRYLELFQKYLVSYRPQQPTQAEIKELTEFEALQHRVSSEQADFLKYTKLVANSRHSDYIHLVPAAGRYVDEKLNYQWRRVDQYARYYVPHKTVPLCVPSDADYAPTLVHQKLLLELGSFPKIFLPDMSRAQTELPTLYDKINKRFPSTGRKTRNSKAWNHEACSRDTNAEILAERHGCQIVTCSSALKCLVDNHAPKFDRDWEIPVVIKQYEHDYGEISTKQRVVYIDKPFAAKVMTNREKNTMYHKFALKTFISQPALPKGQRLVGHNSPANSAKEDTHRRPKSTTPFDEEVNMEDLETFGSFDFSKPAKKSEMKTQESLVDLESFAISTGKSEIKMVNREKSGISKTDTSKPLIHRSDSKSVDACEQIGSDKVDLKGGKSNSSSTRASDGASGRKQSDTSKLETCDVLKVPKKVTAVPKIPVFSSSGGDTSHDESLVIDLPESSSPPPRTTRSTRSQAKKKESESSQSKSCPEVAVAPVRSSPRLTRQTEVGKDLMSDSTDDENGLIIDLEDEHETEATKRRTRSQSLESKEFPIPKRILRKRKTEQVRTSVESESDISPDRHSLRVTRSNSESKASDEPDKEESVKEKVTRSMSVTTPEDSVKDGTKDPTSALLTEVSPSKVDTIMFKTSTDDFSLLPGTKEAQDTPPSAKRSGRRRGVTTAGVSTLDSILKMQEKMLPTAPRGRTSASGQDIEENLSQFRQPEEHNTCYNLWNFSGLSLLVRNSCHGILKGLSQKAQPVLIVPKLEYQVKFGVEQVTMSEVSRDWISCHTKPNTKLVRGRINAFTSELVKIDELELSSIVNPSLPFVPSNALASLHSLFLKLTELPVGQYLLSHSKGDNSCQLQKQTDNKRGSYDLKFSYMGFGQIVPQKTESSVPWIPIDPTVLLPAHRKLGRIPCTFDPSDSIPPKQMKLMNTKKKNRKGQKKKQRQGKHMKR